MKPILTTLTALAVVLAASAGAEAGKGPMVNIKPITPRVQIRPLLIKPRLPVGMNKKREQPSEAADGGPQPEPPTNQAKRTRPRTAKVTPAQKVIAPLPRTKPTMPVAVVGPDDLMTIPPEARDLNAEDFQKLKDFQDMATNGPNNAAPDVFGPRENGRPGDEPGYGGPLGTFENAANRAEANQENRDKQLEDFRATFGNDPNNPGGGDTRQSAGFHTPAKNPGAAGGAVNDPRGVASDGTTTQHADGSHSWNNSHDNADGGSTGRSTTWNKDGSRDSDITRNNPDGSGSRLSGHWDPDGRLVDVTRQTWGADKKGEQIRHTPAGTTVSDYTEPAGQFGAEGRGPGGADNCGWNPMSGCTKRFVKIWDAMVKPGAHQNTGASAAGPSLGQEAVTNTGDGTFDSDFSGGGGGGGRPDPCLTAGGCGGPIGDAGGSPGPAS